MTTMEKTVHQKAHDIACMDREIRKGATPKGIKLWSELGVPAHASSDDIFIIVECMMYYSTIELYHIIKQNHWK